jgi:predicted deacylase
MRHQIHDCSPRCRAPHGRSTAFTSAEQAEGKIYIQSSLHADEMPGMLVAWHLKQRLAELEAPAACAARSCWCRWPTRSAWNKC